MTDLEVAEKWLRDLASLGGRAELRPGKGTGGRLWLKPIAVYRRLPPAMLAVLKTHRAFIKAIVTGRSGRPTGGVS